ncbi:MAG: glycoside hydrolase family 2 protein, partial [Oscillospiraceae bacterium]|nr:glycoside hydrolase family 2 protein [Oscillospiraceae bacterium]
MKTTNWNDNWKFWPDGDAFALVWNVPDIARDVTLPHDAMIESPARPDSPNKGNTGYRDGGNYTYVKHLDLAPEDLGKKHVLKFDGVYCHALIYVNEQLAGSEANGYTTFYVDLTPWLRAGRNEIRVQVKNAGMTNSRWYSGSGIYRDVYLLTAERAYIEADGVRITTESADEDYAVLSVKTALVNDTGLSQSFTLDTALYSAEGGAAGGERSAFFLKAGERKELSQRILVKSPALWSEDSPALYRFESALRLAGAAEPIDRAEGSFGIRTLALDAARGLRVNGRTVKLRGACVHHDSGLLGAATWYDAQYRQVRLLKEAGFNALRISHHPAAPALLRACDELGMYVMDEFSDMWSRAKNDLDYALDFGAWWEKDVGLMVKKDFNHPCVILYSVGNEIPEIGTDGGSRLCAAIAERMRELDPTRYTTAGINGVFAAGDQMGRIMADLSRDMQAAGEVEGNVNDFMTVMDTKMDQIVVHAAISERLEKACA